MQKIDDLKCMTNDDVTCDVLMITKISGYNYNTWLTVLVSVA